jgi:hypothetical protein
MVGGRVQRSTAKVELWHVTLKPSASRECVVREGGDARGRGYEREGIRDDVAVDLEEKTKTGNDSSLLLISYLVLNVCKLTWLNGSACMVKLWTLWVWVQFLVWHFFLPCH